MDAIRKTMQTVRKFLFLEPNKNFLTFLFFLAFSAIFWLMMALNETYEQEIAIPVKITGVPNNVVLTSENTDTVRVILSDKGLVLIGYMYWNAPKTIEIDFSQYATGFEKGTVPAADMQQLIMGRLSASTKIISITPAEETFFFNYGVSKRVPVRWTGTVTPQQPHFISTEIISPDSVDVFASQHLLDSISVVYTEPLNHSEFRDTLRITSALQRVKGIKIVPGSVNLMFTTDILTEGSFAEIPVKSINVPEGKALRTFPSKVTVRFVAGMSILRTIKPEDFAIVVDYQEIVANASETCKIRLATVPDGVSRASLDVTQAEYVIDK